MKLPLAMLCSAVAFPAMLFERFCPISVDPEAVAWQPERSFYHNMKNQTTEAVRADAQWWSKFLCFLALTGWLSALAAGLIK